MGVSKSAMFGVTIFTDSSNSGWGATDTVDSNFGFWSQVESNYPLNYKELLTVKLALERLADNLYDCQILLRVDNTTAISYINKMGGTRFPKYHKLAKSIWQWAESHNIFLFASYIKPANNYQADALSI